MVHSPKYHRLKEFMKAAEANKGLDAWNDEHDKTIKGFEQAVERLKAYRDGHGFKGEAAKAMDNWVNQSIARIEGYRSRYEAKYQTYQDGRATMAKALDEAGSISDTLVDPVTAAMGYLPVVTVPSSAPGDGFSAGPVKITTGSAYVAGVEAQNNVAREAACERILDMLNDDLDGKLEDMKRTDGGRKADDPTKDKHKDKDGGGGGGDNPGGGGGGRNPGGGGGGGHNPGGGGYGGGGYTPENGFGREAGRNGEGYPGGFDKPWWSEADAAAARNRVIASGAVPTKELPYGELGSRTNPITDPQDLMDTDLLHTRVNGTTYRNGVVGGHTPAPAADALHPLWRLNNNAAADAMTAGRLGGAGVLGAGALGMRGAARMGSGSGFGGLGGASGSANGLGMGGLRGISGTTGSAASFGGTNLRVGTYSGSGFGSYTPPASVAGANGAAGAGAPGVTGTTGAGGGAAGAAGAAGRGGAGAGGGFMGGGAGAGAGMGKDDKKGRKRKYVAFSVDEDDDDLPAGYVNPLSQTYGTDRTIAPAKREDDGWDLRQW